MRPVVFGDVFLRNECKSSAGVPPATDHFVPSRSGSRSTELRTGEVETKTSFDGRCRLHSCLSGCEPLPACMASAGSRDGSAAADRCGQAAYIGGSDRRIFFGARRQRRRIRDLARQKARSGALPLSGCFVAIHPGKKWQASSSIFGNRCSAHWQRRVGHR